MNETDEILKFLLENDGKICAQQDAETYEESESCGEGKEKSGFSKDSVFNRNPVKESTWMGRPNYSYYNYVSVKAKNKDNNYLLSNGNIYDLNAEWKIELKFTCSFNATYYFWKSAALQLGIVESLIQSNKGELLAKVLLTGKKNDVYDFRSSYFVHKALRNKKKITTELNCYTPIEKVFRDVCSKLNLLYNLCDCSKFENILSGTEMDAKNWRTLFNCGENQDHHQIFIVQLGRVNKQTGFDIPVRTQLKSLPKKIVSNGINYSMTSLLCSTHPVDMSEHYYCISICQNSNKFFMYDDANKNPKEVSDSRSSFVYYILYVKV